jgi:carboxyl-terminal processing protease
MLQFMKNKILIPLLIIAALAAFFSFRYGGGGEEAQERQALVMQTVMRAIREGHFSPRPIDDSLSYKAFHKMLDNLDYEKKFFTAAEINGLKAHELTIDDEIMSGNMVFFDKLNDLFSKNIDRAEKYYKEMLGQPFDFTQPGQYRSSGADLPWPADEAALKERWHQYLKYRVLAKYVDLKDNREKNKDSLKTETAAKTDAELEQEARESVQKNLDNYFKRLRKIDYNQRFALFVNAVTNSQDPHTDYMPPKDKQRFDEVMSGTFFGIGAQLREEDGKIKVASIITGSPCWKQGELKAGDEILKVGEGNAEPVDIQGYEIDDAVQLIRGKKGTEVRLTVRKVDASVKEIPIIRGEVMLEDVFAKSAIIKSSEGPVGYIYLPEFYSDFQHINGRRCAEDVAIEVQKLKRAGVRGIILDLRHNGGGSLSDVVDMAGLFIDHGPVVQVKSGNAGPMTLRDDNKGMLYDGPLAILVNEGSASASEILAAAMQDYKRAVVVGTPTFGKGTVQKIVSLDDFVDPLTRMQMQANNVPKIGSLKITIQKFYRVNGGSTQLKGVTPDVVLPNPYAKIDLGERRDKSALPWDEIAPANYKPVSAPVNVQQLAALSKKRVAANPVFGLIEENAERLEKQEKDHTYYLSEEAYRKELEVANATSKKLEELEKKGTPYEIANLQDDLKRINLDSASIAKNEDWLKNLKKDIYLSETVNIINDLYKQTMKLNMATGMK